MLLKGSKIKTIETTANQQMSYQTIKFIREARSSHQLHRRYSTSSSIHKEVFNNEDKCSKQTKSLLQIRYCNIHQLFKKKQYIPTNFQQDKKPFQHVVTNQFSKTQGQFIQQKKKFNAREWHKVNYDRFRFLSRQGSIEKIIANRFQSIQPCLQISQANKIQRSASQINNYRTESYNCLHQQRCQCQRSKSLQKENIVIFVIDENQHNQKLQDRNAQIV
ncbi:unnamed protein product [Paramecium sonneborni]|uniref:Uncharacterized protein n=1 Tax=Paramecium sonneborni TaxID=65129 RepID=A0A8S1KU73_9CILI|nr:unnamed protein product [Paramecium sonneborni]